ncbi:hypothetical protein ALP75_200221 [Pseudomonas syringae pv. actinidiae]|nr:hypothetical protein ALP75_200221 [Pseudomonas syringae pv. actinidiae]
MPRAFEVELCAQISELLAKLQARRRLGQLTVLVDNAILALEIFHLAVALTDRHQRRVTVIFQLVAQGFQFLDKRSALRPQF